jgi:hypothetical protein
MIDEFVGAAHGDLAKVKSLLAQNPALMRLTPAGMNRPSRLQLRLPTLRSPNSAEAGAPLNPTAAAFGYREKLESLLRADPELAHARGAHDLPLMYFLAVGGQFEIAEILLSAGSDVNVSSSGGTIALYGAVSFR